MIGYFVATRIQGEVRLSGMTCQASISEAVAFLFKGETRKLGFRTSEGADPKSCQYRKANTPKLVQLMKSRSLECFEVHLLAPQKMVESKLVSLTGQGDFTFSKTCPNMDLLSEVDIYMYKLAVKVDIASMPPIQYNSDPLPDAGLPAAPCAPVNPHGDGVGSPSTSADHFSFFCCGDAALNSGIARMVLKNATVLGSMSRALACIGFRVPSACEVGLRVSSMSQSLNSLRRTSR